MDKSPGLAEAKPGAACECSLAECHCKAAADFVVEGQALCGCCYGDCPEVHPHRAAELWASLGPAMEQYYEALAGGHAGRH